MKLIDVSYFQGKINWGKVKRNIDGVYLRGALRGSLKKTAPQNYMKLIEDERFREYLDGVQKAGIPFSVYFFPTCINDAEALEDAEYFYRIAKDLPVSFPFALDSENVWGKDREAGRANSLSAKDRTRLLKIIMDYFFERGLSCGVYASASWLNNKVDMSAFTDFQRSCTWVADSTGEVDYKGVYWLHQYGQEYVAGISGKVDINRVVSAVPTMKKDDPAGELKIDPIDLVLSIAESEVGYHEKASASGLDSPTANKGSRNYTKYGRDMHAIQPRNMDYPAAWCDCFVDWCFYKAFGAEMARKVLCGDFDDYTYSSVNLYKKIGRWSQIPERGDQIFFGGSGHTGIVYKVENNYVYTIEGNKSDEVRKCSYRKTDGSIIGYGKPLYGLVSNVNTVPVKKTDDLHTVKWGGFTKRETKVYTQPDTTSPTCSFSPIAQAEPVGVCKRIGKFYLCKYNSKYGYIHKSHIVKT